jgi:hypothetical protein
MSLRQTVVVSAVAALLSGAFAGNATAQQVNEIQIAPVDITMTVGDRETFLATAYDDRRNPIVATAMSWVSSNESIVRVELDPASPNVVTVVAVGPGVAQIEARSSSVQSSAVIRVLPAGGAPAADVLSPGVSSLVLPLAVRIQPELFGTSVTCRGGAFVGNNLVLTTYSAIRGASRVTVTTTGGQSVDAQVADYDVAANLAVLYVSGVTGGILTTGPDASGNQAVWALTHPNCADAETTTAQASNPTTLNTSLPETAIGSAIINANGDLIGVAAGGSTIIRVSAVSGVLAAAMGNAGAGNLLTPTEIATRENHIFGSLALQTQVFGASARVTPLETWQWTELQRQGRLPMTFSGAMGRYRVELLSGGQVQGTQEVDLRPGVTTTVSLAAADAVAAAVPPPAQPTDEQIQTQAGGGISPILLFGGGAVALGGILLLVAGGGGDDLPPPNGTQTGGIRIRIPIPSN